MPGPLDALKSLYGAATTPLLPQSAIQPAQDALDSPSLDRSPWQARLGGFAAGALGGLRNLTTPANIAGLALDDLPVAYGASKLLKMAPGAAGAVSGGIQDLSQITPDLVESAPAVRQVMPSSSDVDALIGSLKYGLAKAGR